MATLSILTLLVWSREFSSLYDADVALVAAQAFVSELNTVLPKLNALYDRGGNGGVKGELAGSPLVRSLTNEVRSLMAADLESLETIGLTCIVGANKSGRKHIIER